MSVTWRGFARTSGRAAVALVAAGVLSSCGGGAAFDGVREANGNADRVRSYQSWEDLIREASNESADPGEYVDSVDMAVVGEVLDVEKGRSSTWSLDGEKRSDVEFGSSEAMSSTYHLQVKVSDVVGSDTSLVAPGDTVRVGLALDPDLTLQDVERDFLGLDGAVFFLQRTAVFSYEKDLFGIVEDGALVAIPGRGGQLNFPMLSGIDTVQPPEGTTTADLPD